MKTFLPLLAMLAILPDLGFGKGACTFYPQPISRTLAAYPDRIVALALIVKVGTHHTELDVLEEFGGNDSTETTVRIWDGTDIECNGPWDMGSERLGIPGDTILIIAPRITAMENSWDVLGDYRMPHVYGSHAVFNFKNGTAWYEDRLAGIELKQYTVAEMKSFLEGYIRSASIPHNGRHIRRKEWNRFLPADVYDLNGRRTNRGSR
jgi:hypothetical protein